MSHTDKLAQAVALIAEHNKHVDEADKVNVADFEKALKKAGGTTEDSLRECTWEDLEDCGLPKILARKVASIFRSAVTATAPETTEKVVTAKAADKLNPLGLLQNFDLNDPESAVAKRLKDLSKGKRFLVVKQDGSIDVETSHAELLQLRKGYPERSRIVVNGVPVELRAVGYRKATSVDENPIYKGLALRDGVCDQTNRSWSQVPLLIRQLVHIAIYDTREIKVDSIDDANNVIDRAIAPDAEKTIRVRYVRASTRFDELSDHSNLPKLKVALGENGNARDNDPFFGAGKGHKVY